jgi:hypothetical protein
LEEERAESKKKHVEANVKCCKESFKMKEEDRKWEGNIIIEE